MAAIFFVGNEVYNGLRNSASFLLTPRQGYPNLSLIRLVETPAGTGNGSLEGGN
jgi:hypothetical protein